MWDLYRLFSFYTMDAEARDCEYYGARRWSKTNPPQSSTPAPPQMTS